MLDRRRSLRSQVTREPFATRKEYRFAKKKARRQERAQGARAILRNRTLGK